MNEEDEAFEELSRKQGYWGLQGSRKHQILRYAENVKRKGTSMNNKDAMAMAQEKALQALHNENERLGLYEDAYAEPVAWGVFEGNLHDMFFTQSEAQEMAKLKGAHAEVRPLYTNPPQRTEQNFCSRCGKRTPDLITIHTCTPQENT
jgi:hypothetical protein